MQKSKTRTQALKQAADKSDRDEIGRNIETIRRGNGLSEICKDYLDQVVDCSTKKPVGAPTLMGGVPGKTGVFRLKEELRVVVGTAGYGFLSVCYSDAQIGGVPCGPFNDAPVFSYSTATYAGTDVSARGTALSFGVINKGWTLSQRALSDYALPDAQNAYQWRMVSGLAECTNTTAVLDQNGTIVMWEPPNHGTANSSNFYDLTQCESERTSRVVRAENNGEVVDKVALNFHPKALHTANGDEINDFTFNTFNTVPLGLPISRTPGLSQALIVLQGKPGDTFHFTVSAVYEAKGRLIQGIKPRITDEHGMNIVFNTLAAKALDGYVGNPRRVADGYLAKAWEVSKKIGGWVKQHEATIMKGTGAFLKGIAGLE